MPDTTFAGVPDWPEQAAAPRDPRFDNQPPLQDRIALEFEEQLRDDRLLDRINEITASAGRVPDELNQEIAGKVGDLIAMARSCHKEVEGRREVHNRPLLEAQRALKGRCDALLAPMGQAIDQVKARLNGWLRDEEAKRQAAQRQADEAARKARETAQAEAAKAAEAGQEPAPAPIIEAARVEAPVVRGDTGARVGTRTVWKHEIEVPIKSLPKAVLENERVKEAVAMVIGQMIRSGTREIKGVRIYSEQEATVR